MDRPTVGAVAEELYAAMAPAFSDELDPDWHLLSFCEALGRGLEDIWEVNNNGEEPWSVALDVDNAPDFALPWLASIAGVKVQDSWTTPQLRQAIKDRDGQQRGTPQAMTLAIQRVLTGDKRVEIAERDAGAYHFSIRTYPDDTPNPALVSQAILAQKPAGLQFTHLVSDLQTYAELDSTHIDMASVNSDYASLHDLLLDA